jgi:hypothetical protein
MATVLEKVREALNNAQPGDVSGVKIIELPEGGVRIEVVLNKTVTIKPVSPSRWAMFADAMHRESPLRGYSEMLCQHGREFRDSFTFDDQ